MPLKPNPLTRGKKQKALALLQARQLPEAKSILEQVCRADPRDAEAWYLCGAVNHESGALAEAETCYRQAVALQPERPEAHYFLGNIYLAQEKLPEAADCYRNVIKSHPHHIEAHCNLGAVMEQLGEYQSAARSYGEALRLAPGRAELHYNLGTALRGLGQLDEAEKHFRRTIELKPDFALAYNNLGNVLNDTGRREEALACYKRAIELKPDFSDAIYNLGMALREADRIDEAQACFERALALAPHLAAAHNDLGNIHLRHYRLQAAIDCYRRAIKLSPRYDMAYDNLGNALLAQHRPDEAIAAYREAVRFNPENADAHFNLSMALLLTGNFREGWEKFEWRWRTGRLRPRPLAQPPWDGSALHGRTILLHAEAGLGDTLQFIRYAPLVAGHGGRVIVECQPPLKRLLTRMNENIPVFARGEPLPTFDVHCPLLSLPWLLGTTLETIPANIPYLAADPDDVNTWQARLGPDDRLKVGLVWSGDPRKYDPECRRVDQRRSFPLAIYAPLAPIAGVQFYSLQKGEAAQQARHPPDGMVLVDHTEALHDFADTAALIANLDLVISVDTSVAHLAGALGKPVWLLSRYNGCWRWLTDRSDTPWYPTMRVFRQQTPDGWDDTMSEVVTALRRLSEP